MSYRAAPLLALLFVPVLHPQAGALDWVVLFDGRSHEGWRGYRQDRFPDFGWTLQEELLTIATARHDDGTRAGDLVTTQEFSDFELEFEWRIPARGNSGVKYLVTEDGPRAVALEYQILDDEAYAGVLSPKQECGALYDLIPPLRRAARPIGEFNTSRILVRGNQIEHWLNGIKVVDVDRGSPEFFDLVATSKFHDHPGFGKTRRGRILLQEHSHPVWFRSIRVRELPAG